MKTKSLKSPKWVIHPLESPDVISWTQKITRVLTESERNNTCRALNKFHKKLGEVFEEALFLLKSPPPRSKEGLKPYISYGSELNLNSDEEQEIVFSFSVIDAENTLQVRDSNYRFIRRFILWKFCGESSYAIPGELVPGNF